MDRRMPYNWPLPQQYALVLVAVATALLAQSPLQAVVGERLPFLFTYTILLPLLLLVRPAPFVVAAMLGWAGTVYLYVPRLYSFRVEGPFGSAIAVASCAVLAAVSVTAALLSQRRNQRERELDERYRTLFEAVDDAFCVVDVIFDANDQPVDFRIVETNCAFALHTGLVDAANKRGRELVPDLESHWIETYGQVAKTGDPTRHVREAKSMGRWFEEYVFPVGGSDGRRLAMLFRDVTERKQTEAALRESQERLQVATAAAQLGLHDYDIVGNRVVWDARTRALWGVEPDMPITYEIWRDSLLSEDRVEAEAAVNAALDPAGSGQYLAQYRVRNPNDGVTRWVESTGRTTFVDGKPVRLVGTTQDITERKRVEEALRENDRRKDEFLAMLAHELRNPLAAIRMALNVLEREASHGAQRVQMQSIIDRQSSQLVRLIDDLLDVSRITRGRFELRPETVDLRQLVEHAIDSVRELCARKTLQLSVATGPRALRVHADPIRFAQVLTNLLTNACKFTPRGGAIEVSVAAQGDEAVIRVRDTGAGIPPEDASRIFELFTQVETSHGREGGLGIGLALARSIVVMHGGRIDVHSEGAGRGSEFVVHLPLRLDAVQELPEAVSLPAATSDGEAPSERVLVVDDNPDALEAVAMLLRLGGREVETASHGAEALAKGPTLRPAAIILDIGLPDMDGYEVARRIRRSAWGKDVLLIAMTGWGQEKDKQRAREAGFDAHLTKPADPEHLERLLNRCDQPDAATLQA